MTVGLGVGCEVSTEAQYTVVQFIPMHPHTPLLNLNIALTFNLDKPRSSN